MSTVSPRVILAVAAFIAGHPVTVSCEAATNRPPSVPIGALGWSVVGGSESHLSGDICNDLEDSPGGGRRSVERTLAFVEYVQERARTGNEHTSLE